MLNISWDKSFLFEGNASPNILSQFLSHYSTMIFPTTKYATTTEIVFSGH